MYHFQFIEAERHLQRFMQNHADPRWYMELRYCVPQIVELLNLDSSEAGFEELVAAVRRIVLEHCQVDEGGDAMLHGDQGLDREIELLAAELCRLRRARTRRGEASGTPVPPLMCG